MDAAAEKTVLISGASIAGLSAAYWMNRLGYRVTVVELASQPRVHGAAGNIEGIASDAVRRMGLLDRLKSHALTLEKWEYKNADDVTEGTVFLNANGEQTPEDAIEIERDKLIGTLFDAVKSDTEFLFGNSITALDETEDAITATFKDGTSCSFDLVLGCDGLHSGVRKIWFGPEAEYARFLNYYFSLTIADKLLIPQGTAQMYNVPGKGIMLNAYNGKTDIIFCFHSATEIPYDYRDTDWQREIILEQFSGQSWRTSELLEEVKQTQTSYFDKICQITMPSWTRGRVALVGDAAHCASPAAGIGASLAIAGAAALADALAQHDGNFERAFPDYDRNLRPFIEEVQSDARTNLTESLMPGTEEAIQARNLRTTPF